MEVDVKVEGEEDHVKMERERWSEVWKYYTRLPIGTDGRERAECDRCKKRYIYETKNGTGSLRNHIPKCPRRDNSDITQFIFAKSGGSISINSTVFKPERFRELISEAIVKHDLPFKFVEYTGIREIFSYLNEKVTRITRNTAKEDVLNLFKREKGKFKKLFELLPRRISLTVDLWSSINTDGFLCVTSHFIDEEWKLQKRILNFQYMPPPHNGLFTITLDNAASNDTFVNLLKGQLCNEGALRSNGDYFHVQCCAHVLNLVVQDGLKAIDEGIVKIRESIKWNANFLMIESALFYRRAFFRLALSDSNYLDCPSNEEWVERTLKEEIESSDTFMKIMACKMYEKFSKYWSEYSPILAMAAVLDQRYKMQYVEFTYKKLYGSSFREHNDCIREKLHDLFGEYVIELPMSYRASTVSTSDSSNSVYKKKDDKTLSKSTREMLQEFTVYETKEFALSQKSQLEMYLDEPRSEVTEDINVLSFWKAHQYRYPELASMARDILSIPVSTVASESAFSNGGRVLDQYRSSLKHENVEALICAKDWLFGIKGDEELCLQYLTKDVMKLDSHANGTHEEMESQA
ncbi:zinc finger BED domain-containing protein RICESLEEPER 2-like [Lactuca sativa]|uniref:zinc finger BED domain-containing protein RICESLEEPER 2-like n=1 Tax=Lactuca sativa TaxID=4236 RepID=UPI0022AF586E|nr:zinc finger BED domain-containing protein RICESLEEPER 2-like [Lactuca sativa]